MEVKRTTEAELDEIMRIYAGAVSYMAQNGNPNQWVKGYPSAKQISADIRDGVSYVLIEDGIIHAVFSYIEGEDATYAVIEQGEWRTNGSYGTIHRLASARRRSGMAAVCFAWCKEQGMADGCVSLRADTHADNRIMQQCLEAEGFAYCGVIRLADGAPRLAYEYVYQRGKS